MNIKLKKLDYIVIIVLLFFTISSLLIVIMIQQNKANNNYVEILLDGELYKRVPLKTTNETIKIQTETGFNIVNINDGNVYISDADCPDKICIKDGAIDRSGQILVCLPNKLVIQITGKTETGIDDTSF